ncbi:hypothetical protein GBA65_02980 [Rubrobacter marinus]|uniref:Uncharacterized protein n=1 Tax=Rubrobacter marinus TaxID=2653852 RepID=A0A6G8PT18_9ACTN|nr:hypothetical protein GBA65_02980 [Rubrobacter marinus]
MARDLHDGPLQDLSYAAQAMEILRLVPPRRRRRASSTAPWTRCAGLRGRCERPSTTSGARSASGRCRRWPRPSWRGSGPWPPTRTCGSPSGKGSRRSPSGDGGRRSCP